MGGLEEEADYGVCGGASTLPFTPFPCWGMSLELEAIRDAGAHNKNRRARSSASDTNTTLIYKRVFGDFL